MVLIANTDPAEGLAIGKDRLVFPRFRCRGKVACPCFLDDIEHRVEKARVVSARALEATSWLPVVAPVSTDFDLRHRAVSVLDEHTEHSRSKPLSHSSLRSRVDVSS